jgi:hypothetical protein
MQEVDTWFDELFRRGERKPISNTGKEPATALNRSLLRVFVKGRKLRLPNFGPTPFASLYSGAFFIWAKFGVQFFLLMLANDLND